MIKKILKEFFIRFTFITKNKRGKKKALLCFIVHPFFVKGKKHPNSIELENIVSILAKLDYHITVVDYRRKKIFGMYDLVIGFGDCFEYAITHNLGKKNILYSTGFPAFIQNQNALEALFRFKKNYPSKVIDSANKYVRITENVWPNQLVKSDAIITIGNEYIKKLFELFHDNIYCVPSTCFSLDNTTANKDSIENSEIELNSFIWFGGKGCIHKGLDLCIDAFAGSQYKLYIAGPLDDEINLFQDKLLQYPENFDYLGFLDIESSEFNLLVKKIPFSILPSCSEAMATSIVTLSYNFGTIPVITKECGFDFNSDMIQIESLTLQAVQKAIWEASQLSIDNILSIKKSIRNHFIKYHNQHIFNEAFMLSLKKELR
ncbi:hypothetical protein [Citrobacter amalonaticus]|uniref:Glycosyltransferase n=1 Tax=Citrobacter amalonaticus TaxID=35703 RepID=A0A8I0SZ73_CITAM|nr:hypothetical protein [Citrobacter amalonaticus]MBE0129298.1 hypothetical protein [Citrobacter amalonaticus]MEC5724691.1 hypothetical protein [Citrobacter amalonaticus]